MSAEDGDLEELSRAEGLLRTAAWVLRPKFTAGALVCVMSPEGRIPLVRSRLRQQKAWGFPGGFLKRNESAAFAAIREVKEEVGLDIDAVTLEAEYRQPWSRHFDCLVTANSTSERVRGAGVEVAHIKWFEPEEISELVLTRETKLAWNRFLKGRLCPDEDTGVSRANDAGPASELFTRSRSHNMPSADPPDLGSD